MAVGRASWAKEGLSRSWTVLLEQKKRYPRPWTVLLEQKKGFPDRGQCFLSRRSGIHDRGRCFLGKRSTFHDRERMAGGIFGRNRTESLRDTILCVLLRRFFKEDSIMDISDLYELFIHHRQVSTDSRNCPKNCLFFALKGERFDGNKYAKDALEAGAAYAIIDDPKYAIGDRCILVDDALRALQQLAHRHRKALGTPLIAVTGTNGKTTTKELLAAVLSTKYNVLYTEGNLNNAIGVPLTLLRLTIDHEMAVIEMGANHPGEIKALCEIAAPNYGLITNVGRAHLEGFGSFEGVLHTKGELYDYLRHTHGKIFIQKENKDLQSIAKGLEQITYGQAEGDFAVGHVVSADPYLTFDWKQQGKVHTVETHLIGNYNLDNLLAAVAAGRYFKIPAERISRAIAAYEPTNHRSQLLRTAKNEVIVDAYNANPSSMKAALDNFARMTCQPKAVILGDMYELGETSDALHQEVVDQLQATGIEQALLCGPHFSQTKNAYETFATTDALRARLAEHPLEGYHILLKGSHAMALESLIELL